MKCNVDHYHAYMYFFTLKESSFLVYTILTLEKNMDHECNTRLQLKHKGQQI